MKGFLILSLSLIVGSMTFAQTTYKAVANQDEVIKKLNATAEKLNTISSDFTQEKHMEFLEFKVISKGKFWFQKESNIRWEYNDPYKYVVIINDGKVIIDDEGNNSEFKVKGNKTFQQVNDIIVASVRGEIAEDERFKLSIFESNSHYLVKLVPRVPEIKEVISEMYMFFDKETLTISKVKMMETSEDYTLIKFENRKTNEPLPANIFKLN